MPCLTFRLSSTVASAPEVSGTRSYPVPPVKELSPNVRPYPRNAGQHPRRGSRSAARATDPLVAADRGPRAGLRRIRHRCGRHRGAPGRAAERARDVGGRLGRRPRGSHPLEGGQRRAVTAVDSYAELLDTGFDDRVVKWTEQAEQEAKFPRELLEH